MKTTSDAAQALQGVTDFDKLAYRFWSIHPKDIPEPVGMPDGYKGGARAWFYATEMRAALSEQNAALAAQVAELTRERDEALSAARQQDKLREATLATLRGVSADLEAAEAKVARLEAMRVSAMKAMTIANGALDPTATEKTFRRDLVQIREELRGALWPAALTEGTPTEYERKVAQMKEDFPNGI